MGIRSIIKRLFGSDDVQRAHDAAERAAEEAQAAEADRVAKEGALDAARTAYEADPSEDHGAAFLRARDAAALASMRARTMARRAEVAANERDVARAGAALDTARKLELEAATIERDALSEHGVLVGEMERAIAAGLAAERAAYARVQDARRVGLAAKANAEKAAAILAGLVPDRAGELAEQEAEHAAAMRDALDHAALYAPMRARLAGLQALLATGARTEGIATERLEEEHAAQLAAGARSGRTEEAAPSGLVAYLREEALFAVRREGASWAGYSAEGRQHNASQHHASQHRHLAPAGAPLRTEIPRERETEVRATHPAIAAERILDQEHAAARAHVESAAPAPRRPNEDGSPNRGPGWSHSPGGVIDKDDYPIC